MCCTQIKQYKTTVFNYEANVKITPIESDTTDRNMRWKNNFFAYNL